MPRDDFRRGGGSRGDRFGGGNRSFDRPQDETFTVERFAANERVLLKNAAGETIEADWSQLGVADQILAIRPGAKFRGRIGQDRKFKASMPESFTQYAPDVQKGLGTAPNTDRNPYNFVAWMGKAPWPAESPNDAVHDKDNTDRYTGIFRVFLTATTPIYVPRGSPPVRAEDEPLPDLDFFRCWNGTRDCYALPGSTVKGAVRSLFEALTNSRVGILDDKHLAPKPLYRRRACQSFVVTKVPTIDSDGEAEECQFCFLNNRGQKADVRLPPSVDLPDPPPDGSKEQQWRANLFWVTSGSYAHRGKVKIRYRSTGNTVKIRKEDYALWLEMRTHRHFTEWHEKNVRANRLASEVYANSRPTFRQWGDELFTLKENQLLFGMKQTVGRDVCLRPFGKNVNFLWPSASPAQLVDNFAARSEDGAMLIGSDPAELTFGFIAKGEGTHCFRSRVRFGTFWHDEKASAESAKLPSDVTLLHLPAPSNARGKSRVLYYEPVNNGPFKGEPPDPGSEARLRGRKMYWHQKAHPEAGVSGIPRQHCADVLLEGGPQPPEKNPAQRIHPLGTGACFDGEIHFSNLTPAELGALLAAVDPNLLFQTGAGDSAIYGIKLGKGKPRGLGSVRVSSMTLALLDTTTPSTRYRTLNADPKAGISTTSATPSTFIDAYRKWVVALREKSGLRGRFDEISAIKDIKALTLIPAERDGLVCVYPARFDQYGWNAGWCDPVGAPNDTQPARVTTHKKRPKAMRIAGLR